MPVHCLGLGSVSYRPNFFWDRGTTVSEDSSSSDDTEYMLPGSMSFLVFLTLLNVMNFIDRGLLGSFANFIVPDLNLTNTEFGLLTLSLIHI